MQPFAPNTTGTATLSVSSTTGNVAVMIKTLANNQLELNNTGSKWCYVAVGSSTVTATVPSGSTGSYPVGPGQCKLITISPNDVTNVAAICGGTDTTTLTITPGNGAS